MANDFTNNPNPNGELTPPVHLVFDKCPVCGSKRRDLEMEIAYRKKAGLLPPTYPDTVMDMLPLMDQSKPPALITADFMTKVPVAYMYKERCADCGTFYGPKWEVVEQKGKVTMRPPA
jgi:hypothetical protein